ncbi:MAG: YgiT-type zinc finger protein [Chloroflexi bacterium]|nr:YgiT-type zinc finger protein [Chloroflexota bacterium]
MESEKCRSCGREMKRSITTFTVAKDTAVYVVKGVPCFQCLDCGETIFDQETALKLSKYTSGKVLAVRKPLTAYLFHWSDPLTEATTPRFTGTENRSVVAPVGTALSAVPRT